MKRTLIVLALLVFVLPLSACGSKTKVSETQSQESKVQKQVKKTQDDAALIKKNQAKWAQLTKDVATVDGDGFSGDYVSIPMSLKELKKSDYKSSATIKGTVYNLEQMSAPKNMVWTKATIHIDKVLSGDKSIVGKNYYVVLRGGLTTSDVFYADTNHTKEADHKILVGNPEAPLPQIGTKVITQVAKNQAPDNSEYGQNLKKSGFTDKNSREIQNLQYNFWVKAPGASEYVLNNPQIQNKKDTSEDYLAGGLQNLTKEINQKYNQ